MKCLFLVGPTATGKSDFAIEIAKLTKSEIINADSVQFYQKVNIGTAKVTAEQREITVHHLIDIVAPMDEMTAGQFCRLAHDVLKDIERRQCNAIIVGGSGFYIQALESGMYDLGAVPVEIHEAVLTLAERDLPSLFLELQANDSEYAQKIGPNDKYRISRAVELIRHYGESPRILKQRFEKKVFPYSYQKFGLKLGRDLLLERVRIRTKKMLENGLLNEVRSLVDGGLRNWAPLSSVGYKECVSVIEGKLAVADLETQIVQNTMRLAKRQGTWFRRDPNIQWFDAISEHNQLIEYSVQWLTADS